MSRYDEILSALEPYTAAQGISSHNAAIMQIGKIESTLDPSKRAIDPKTGRRLSSAEGVWQFIDSTWAEYGGGDKFSIKDQARNIARFTASNIKGFEARNGRPPDSAELYLAHFGGLGTANKVARALASGDGGRSITHILSSKQIEANMWIKYNNKSFSSLTVQEFYDWADLKMDGVAVGHVERTPPPAAISDAIKTISSLTADLGPSKAVADAADSLRVARVAQKKPSGVAPAKGDATFTIYDVQNYGGATKDPAKTAAKPPSSSPTHVAYSAHEQLKKAALELGVTDEALAARGVDITKLNAERGVVASNTLSPLAQERGLDNGTYVMGADGTLIAPSKAFIGEQSEKALGIITQVDASRGITGDAALDMHQKLQDLADAGKIDLSELDGVDPEALAKERGVVAPDSLDAMDRKMGLDNGTLQKLGDDIIDPSQTTVGEETQKAIGAVGAKLQAMAKDDPAHKRYNDIQQRRQQGKTPEKLLEEEQRLKAAAEAAANGTATEEQFLLLLLAAIGAMLTGNSEQYEEIMGLLMGEGQPEPAYRNASYGPDRRGGGGGYDPQYRDGGRTPPYSGAGGVTGKDGSPLFVIPMDGTISSPFGERSLKGHGHDARLHAGVDIAAVIGTPVYPAAEGIVSKIGFDPNGYGRYVDVTHSDGSMMRYAHLSSESVRKGDKVDFNTVIAKSGNTGGSEGPHLHVEYRDKNGAPLEPKFAAYGHLDTYRTNWKDGYDEGAPVSREVSMAAYSKIEAEQRAAQEGVLAAARASAGDSPYMGLIGMKMQMDLSVLKPNENGIAEYKVPIAQRGTGVHGLELKIDVTTGKVQDVFQYVTGGAGPSGEYQENGIRPGSLTDEDPHPDVMRTYWQKPIVVDKAYLLSIDKGHWVDSAGAYWYSQTEDPGGGRDGLNKHPTGKNPLRKGETLTALGSPELLQLLDPEKFPRGTYGCDSYVPEEATRVRKAEARLGSVPYFTIGHAGVLERSLVKHQEEQQLLAAQAAEAEQARLDALRAAGGDYAFPTAALPTALAGAKGATSILSHPDIIGVRRDGRKGSDLVSDLMVAQIRSGNVPQHMRNGFVPLKISGDKAGEPEIVVGIMTDYAAFGRDGDFSYLSLGRGQALQVAALYNASFPTEYLERVITDRADEKVRPGGLTDEDVPGFHRTSPAWQLAHDKTIQTSSKAGPSAVKAGHKKVSVITDESGYKKGAIFGLLRPGGGFFQPVFGGHSGIYTDYSEAERLISQVVYVDGAPVPYADILADRDYAKYVRGEGKGALSPKVLRAQGLHPTGTPVAMHVQRWQEKQQLLLGSAGADLFSGGSDTLTGSMGDDSILGAAGDDMLLAGAARQDAARAAQRIAALGVLVAEEKRRSGGLDVEAAIKAAHTAGVIHADNDNKGGGGANDDAPKSEKDVAEELGAKGVKAVADNGSPPLPAEVAAAKKSLPQNQAL